MATRHANQVKAPNGSQHLRSNGIDRILVIGGAGYVGSVLVRRLLDTGCKVTVMDALMYGDDGISELYGLEGFDVVRGDLRDVQAVVEGCRFADAIVHLGAVVGDPACALDEQLALEINRDTTRTAAAVARGLGIKRFVFASTCSVYGAGAGVLDEDSPLGPVSIYARTKMESEQLLLEMDDGFAPVILRFGTFYGSSPRERFDLVINLLVAKAVTEGEITILGGSQWRPFVHVADGAEAIVRCLEAPLAKVSRQVFNVGSNEQNHTLAEIAEIIVEAVPDVRVNFAEEVSEEANYRVSFDRIQNALGFRPTRTLVDGVAEIKAAIENGIVRDYADTRYSNVKSLAVGKTLQDEVVDVRTSIDGGDARNLHGSQPIPTGAA